MNYRSSSKYPSVRESPYRYVVVPRGLPFYGVLDRATNTVVADDLSRRVARQIVWAKNRRLAEDGGGA